MHIEGSRLCWIILSVSISTNLRNCAFKVLITKSCSLAIGSVCQDESVRIGLTWLVCQDRSQDRSKGIGLTGSVWQDQPVRIGLSELVCHGRSEGIGLIASVCQDQSVRISLSASVCRDRSEGIGLTGSVWYNQFFSISPWSVSLNFCVNSA